MAPGTTPIPYIPTNPLKIVEAQDSVIFMNEHRVVDIFEAVLGGLFNAGKAVDCKIQEESVDDDEINKSDFDLSAPLFIITETVINRRVTILPPPQYIQTTSSDIV